jgi:hypothetical protein
MADIKVQTQALDRDEIQRLVGGRSFRAVKFFENLGKDVSTTIPEAIESSIQGPLGGSVDDNVVVFDGTTGYKVKDSGVSIDDLAPLDSPAFTGSPTAPTPPAIDSSTRIATTAFVDGAVTGGVKGPASATNNAIALFDGGTGKLIKDSAVLLNTLAPLDSPGFTNNPTAPTAAAGDSDTTLATTAFVQGEFAARVALGAYFSAHNNGTAQSIPTGAFTQVTLGTEAYDAGNKFASNAWTPPAGRLVTMKGAVAIATTASAAIYTVAVFKNGAEYKRGTMYTSNQVGTQVVTVDCDDVPNGTDVYDMRIFQNTGAAQNTNGSSTLTWFQGYTVQT